MFIMTSRPQAENNPVEELEVVSFRITDSPLTFRNSPAQPSLSATADSRAKFGGGCSVKTAPGGFFRNIRKSKALHSFERIHQMVASFHRVDDLLVPSDSQNQQLGSEKLRKKSIQKSKRVLKRTGVAERQDRQDDHEGGSQICFSSKSRVDRPSGIPSLKFTMNQLNPSVF